VCLWPELRTCRSSKSQIIRKIRRSLQPVILDNSQVTTHFTFLTFRNRLGQSRRFYFRHANIFLQPSERRPFLPKHTHSPELREIANMSREAYQVPTAVPTPGRDSFQTSLSVEGPAINYLCGDCNAKVPLKRGDPIRCKECGHRVLYKERTKR